ncbi:hypothetical protein Pcinc_002864 [Petrolisthes cinctipes]|uniref:Uncharacterized protein n=1 Tax=Petrolisthes cinctipes TaxID=88211 RepID=A0AAE1GHD3_PETCI|nr:hypothetical protein Pcinc_002864 [Petrolisthes cinctipes]
MRTRNRPGSEDDDDTGLHTVTLHQSDRGMSSPAKLYAAATGTHQNDSYFSLIKNSEATCANNSAAEATATTVSPDDSFTVNTITSDNQMSKSSVATTFSLPRMLS